MNDQLAIYKCADGTDFPVTWFAPDDPSFVWTREVTHYPLLETPLEVSIRDLSVPERLRVFEAAGLQAPYVFHHDLAPQGFVYLNRNGGTRDNEAHSLGIEALLSKWGGLQSVFTDYCLPIIQKACYGLQTEAGSWSLLELINASARGSLITQVAGAVVQSRMTMLRGFLVAELGPEGELLSTDLTSGQENATSDADQALCDLAALSQELPAVRDALVNADGDVSLEALGSLDGGSHFSESFEKLLDVYGWRAESWQIVAPAWRERPEVPLRLVRQLLLQGYHSPEEAMHATAVRREAATQETMARLAPAKQAELRRLLESLDGYVFVREGRAFWQLTSCGSLRHALLLRGERLQSVGLIEATEDVLLLIPEELEAALAGDHRPLQDVVAARKAEHAYWQTKEPPETIGATPKAAPSAAPVESILIRGVGSSRGVVTGTARIVDSVDDGARLQPGDVLVCRMTSPVWTPLFAIAGAVVTDSGGMLAHMSITAREYGIPCVCATKSATKVIPDGALIRVDGVAGTVEVLGPD